MSLAKKDTTIKALLGLSQEEMAMLLGISRTQWAMFSTGKRDIPLAAQQQLAAVVSNLQKNKSVAPISSKLSKEEKSEAQDWLKQEYKSNKHKQLYLDRKINTMEQIRKEAFKALEVVQYLESLTDNPMMQSLAQSIKSRATTNLNKHSLKQFQELQLKKETLEMLKIKIEEKIKL